MNRTRGYVLAGVLTAAAVSLSACAGGGASDVAAAGTKPGGGQASGDASAGTINL
jgi:hypothetical protein